MLRQSVSKQTQKSWLTNAGLLMSAVIAALSGIYFLLLPKGGYQGGRNSLYDLNIIFSRDTWDDLHTWGGTIMMIAAVIHLVLHWRWVTSMVRRTWNEITGKCGRMNPRVRLNLILNTLVGISFTLTALSGVYLLFVPGGRWSSDPMNLFNRTTWDLIHTWAGITLITTATIHIAIHWRWVTNVTIKMAGMLFPSSPVPQSVTITNQ